MDNCIVIGDGATAAEDGQVVIGDGVTGKSTQVDVIQIGRLFVGPTLFGEPSGLYAALKERLDV